MTMHTRFPRRLVRSIIGVTALASLLAAAAFAQRPRTRRTPSPPSAAAVPRRPSPPVIPTPRSVLGFEPGDDRKLVEWPVLVRYFEALAKASDRIDYRELGKTTLGAPFIALVISSPQNLRRLDYYRQVNAGLADPRSFRTSRAAREALQNGKAIVLVTSSIHSTEVGGHLSPVALAYRLATDTGAATRAILDNVILWLVPSLNPDGVTIVAKWYNRTIGTTAEGTSPPELYHHYTGHDNNRDWYAFTQVETQLTVDSLYNVWHPQIVHDIHQMDANGARLFLPPYLDPVEPNVDPLLIDGVNALGSAMAWELAGQGKTGISINSTYDAWTPARASSTTTVACGFFPRRPVPISRRRSMSLSTGCRHASAATIRANGRGISRTPGAGGAGRCATSSPTRWKAPTRCCRMRRTTASAGSPTFSTSKRARSTAGANGRTLM